MRQPLTLYIYTLSHWTPRKLRNTRKMRHREWRCLAPVLFQCFWERTQGDPEDLDCSRSRWESLWLSQESKSWASCHPAVHLCCWDMESKTGWVRRVPANFSPSAPKYEVYGPCAHWALPFQPHAMAQDHCEALEGSPRAKGTSDEHLWCKVSPLLGQKHAGRTPKWHLSMCRWQGRCRLDRLYGDTFLAQHPPSALQQSF